MKYRGMVRAAGFAGLVALLTIAGVAGAEDVQPGTTLANLMTAYNAESNAAFRHGKFAQQADAEGYPKAAQLFRAFASSENVHLAAQAEQITKLGGTAKAVIDSVKVGSTEENLEASLATVTDFALTMYPKFRPPARKDGNKDALRLVNWAIASSQAHIQLCKAALKDLASYKAAGPGWWVCQVCGYTVVKVDFAKCPICYNPKEKYKLIS